jgi:hypothetical protein
LSFLELEFSMSLARRAITAMVVTAAALTVVVAPADAATSERISGTRARYLIELAAFATPTLPAAPLAFTVTETAKESRSFAANFSTGAYTLTQGSRIRRVTPNAVYVNRAELRAVAATAAPTDTAMVDTAFVEAVVATNSAAGTWQALGPTPSLKARRAQIATEMQSGLDPRVLASLTTAAIASARLDRSSGTTVVSATVPTRHLSIPGVSVPGSSALLVYRIDRAGRLSGVSVHATSWSLQSRYDSFSPNFAAPAATSLFGETFLPSFAASLCARSFARTAGSEVPTIERLHMLASVTNGPTRCLGLAPSYLRVDDGVVIWVPRAAYQMHVTGGPAPVVGVVDVTRRP